MTDLFLLILIGMSCLISYQIQKLQESTMSAFTDLGDAMTALATALDGYVTFTDSLFAQLQTALANQTPADALAAVQAATATALAEKAKIDADIAKDVLPPSGSAAPKG